MAERQRLVVTDLTRFGMVNEVDPMDCPPNAFTIVQNMAYYKNRIGQAARFGTLSSANTIFHPGPFRVGELWELYNSGVLKIKAGEYAEYENSAGTMYEIPCWLGLYATNASGVFTGQSLDGGWSTATFPRAPNKWLKTDDKVFTAPLATPELGENFTNLGGWKFTVSGVSTWPTAGAVYRDGSSQDYTVGYSDSSGGFVYAYGPTTPPASGTLTKQSGTGDASITYSARTNVVTLKTYADWTDSSTAILQSDTVATYADTAYNATTTEGLAFNSGTIGHITNQFFTIRKIKLLAEGANASLIVRDNTTKRGYALQVEETATPGSCYTFTVNANHWQYPPVAGDVYTSGSGGEYTVVGHVVKNGLLIIYTEGNAIDPTYSPGGYNTIRRADGYSGGQPIYEFISYVKTGPFTVTIRLWDGYFDSADSAVGVNAAVVWEKTAIYDWGYSAYNDVYYEDLWMWWRDNFVTFGYGPNALGCVTTSATPAAPRVGFALKNAYIGAASSGKNCIYSIDVAAGKTGPYNISAVAATTLTLTSPPADGDYLIWGCKNAGRTKIVTASDYVLFVTDNTYPVTIWRCGMMEEVPVTNPSYDATFAYAANDACVFKGRVFLAGAHKMILKANASAGYSWVAGYNTPTLVKWSSPYYPDVWEDSYPSGTSASVYYGAGHIDFSETNGAVNAIGQLRDVLVVYKSDAIAMLSPTGIALDPFQVDYMAWNVGVNTQKCIGITPLMHYFYNGDKFWRVEIGEVSLIKLKATFSAPDRFWVLPSDDTVFFGKGDSIYPTIGYNEKYDAVYYMDVPLVHLTSGKNYVFGLVSSGKYYYYSTANQTTLASIARTNEWLTSFLIVGPRWTFGDLLNNKTIYNIDVYARDVNNTGYSGCSVNMKLMVNSTEDAAYTEVVGEKTGSTGINAYSTIYPEKGDWRFRWDRVATGLMFQLAIKLDPTKYPDLEISRIEVEYEPTGPSKKA